LEQLKGATRQAFCNLVNEAIRTKVDLLVIAGDLYDGDWPDYNTGLFFVQEMTRLDKAGIPVVAIAGNHDAQSKITKSLRLPSNVTFCSVEKPETVVFEELKVAVHGQGFAKQAVTEDLSLHYPAPKRGYFNLGLLHTSADGRPGHDNYAPCRVDSLKRFGYHYWALGHIHQREVLCQDPWIVFSGNIQGRHARETGPKGATLVTVDGDRVQGVEELFLDVTRWVHVEVDISALTSMEDFLECALDGLQEESRKAGARLLAFRVVATGRGPLHAVLSADTERVYNELRSLAVQLDGPAWLEKFKLKSGPPPNLLETGDALNELLAGIRRTTQDEKLLVELGDELFCGLLKKLPREWRTGSEGFDPCEPQYLREAVEDALGLLEERLSKMEGDHG
jgi:DNA repair exonuclease SbcCD nuclease subunit